jgi:RNA-binding protein
MTGAERRELRGRAQSLEPVMKLGHGGITDSFVRGLDEALTAHELVKIRFTDFKDQKKKLAPELAVKTGSELITLVGNVAVFFRKRAVAGAE